MSRTHISSFSVRMKGGVPAAAQCLGCGDAWFSGRMEDGQPAAQCLGCGDTWSDGDDAASYGEFVAEHTAHTDRPDD